MSIPREIREGEFYVVTPHDEDGEDYILPKEDFTSPEDYHSVTGPYTGVFGRNLDPQTQWVASDSRRDVLERLREEDTPQAIFDDLKDAFGYVILVHEDGEVETWRRAALDPPEYRELRAWVQDLIASVNVFMSTDERCEAFVGEHSIGRPENRKGSRLVEWPVGETDPFTWIPTDPLGGPVLILIGFASSEEMDLLEEEGLLNDFKPSVKREKIPATEVPYLQKFGV